jgi:neutral ceramidase
MGEDMLKCGVAKVDITPAVGTELCGHFRSDLKSVGIHSNLYAKALILDSDGERVVLVSCDLLGVTSTLVASARKRIEEMTGIKGENVMISCTHTHSGPGSMPCRVIGRSDEAYQDQLVKKIAGAVYLALGNMREASVGLGVGFEDLAASRRVKWPDGSIRFDWLDPNAPPKEEIDKELKVLTVRSMRRETIAVVVNFACHPVTIGGKAFNLISSDFPGVATELIEKVKGCGTVALFFNGAYADTHPRKDLIPGYNYYTPIEGDELTMTLGTILGASALKISETTHTRSDVSIDVCSEVVRVPLEKAPSEEELENRIPEEKRRLEELMKVGAPSNEWWWLKQRLDWYHYVLDLYRQGKRFEEWENLEIQVIRIGDIYVVGIPGEVFSRIGLEIKRRAREIGLDKVLVFALTNGNPGYIPAEEDYTIAPVGKRGYELEGSYMLYGRPLVGPGTATTIIETAVKLMSKLKP